MRTPKTPFLVLAVACALSAPAAAPENQADAASRNPPAAPAPVAQHTSKNRDAVLAADARVSPWVKQVCKLVEANTDESVVGAFIHAAGTFNLTWQQIVQLRDLGIPNDVVAAMLSHDTLLSAGLLPPPGPPPIRMLPPLRFSTNAPSSTAAVTPRTENPDDTIVNPSPAEELAGSYDGVDWKLDEGATRPASSAVAAPFSPVREPYPVTLTDPIFVFRSAWRQPNVQVIEWFP